MKIGEFHDKKLEAAMSDFLSIFGGEDGGAGYYKLCMGLKNIEAQLPHPSAEDLIGVVLKFHKLIKALNK